MNLINWLWPISAGVADAAVRPTFKISNLHNFLLNGFGLLYGLPFLAIYLFLDGMPQIKPAFWIVVAFHVPCYVLIQIFTAEAHRAGTLLKTMPFSSLTPAFLLITSPLMGSGTPTFLGAIGILVIVTGLYLLHIDPAQIGILTPFRIMYQERAAKFMFGASLIAALSANWDLQAVQNASPAFYILIDHAAVTIILLILALVWACVGRLLQTETSPKGDKITTKLEVKNIWQVVNKPVNRKALLWYGIANAATGILHNSGLVFFPHVPYFIAGKRTGAIIFVMFFGLLMSYNEIIRKIPLAQRKFRDEGQNLKWKMLGTAIVIIGMITVIVFGKA